MTYDQRVRFEELQRTMVREALRPAGFGKETTRSFVRRISADVLQLESTDVVYEA